MAESEVQNEQPNFVEQFKKRSVVSPTVRVEYEKNVFTVKRFSPSEQAQMFKHARKLLRDEGLEPETSTGEQQWKAANEARADFLKKHLVSWELEDKSIEFHKQNIDRLFDSMTELDKVLLGYAYFKSCTDDAEKKTGESPLNGETS